MSYRMPGGGTVMSNPVQVVVNAGAMSLTLPDTTQTYPANICFAMTYPQGTLPVGYSTLQPHTTAYNAADWCQAGVCNLDNYMPGNQPLPTLNAVQSINYVGGQLTFTGAGVSQSGNTFTFAGGGSGITQLTGDGTAGPGSGSQAFTLSTVNSSPGTCGDSTHVSQVAVNGKGLVTNCTPVAISSGGMVYPSSGLAASTGSAWRTPTFSDVVHLWASGSCTSGYLKYDGTCATPSGGSPVVIYASQVTGVTPGQVVIPGSSSTGDPDSWTALNTITSAGNVDLEVDSGFALSAALTLGSNTVIHCTSPQFGFIMLPSSNASVLQNAHLTSPTTASGTGGYLVSNQTDSNIRVNNCVINANSTQAVTGSNYVPVLHGATPGGKFTFATEFIGVNGLRLEGNEMYDSAAFAEIFSNDSNVYNIGNYIHQPSTGTFPTVHQKFTDCVHFNGPDVDIWNQNNRLTCGDDSIAYNSDDGFRPGSGDPNQTYGPASLLWGPIQNVHDDNNLLDNSFFGLRLYSATELIDNVEVTNLRGNACGNTGTLEALSALGVGNVGTVKIKGWAVTTNGACNDWSQPYNFIISENIKNLSLDVQNTNPGVNWPELTMTAANVGILKFSSELETQTSSFSNVIALNGGSINQLELIGNVWDDAITNTGSFLSGSAVPVTLTCSGFAGPNRLLAGGFAPPIENGDCFTNTYTAIYVGTSFTEENSGNLAGTAPSICTSGSGCTWTLSNGGTDFTYSGSGSVVNSTTNNLNSFDVINTGHTNETIRFNRSDCTMSASTGFCQFLVRATTNGSSAAASGLILNVYPSSNYAQLYDVVGGSGTLLGTITGTYTGNYTIVLNGTSVVVTNQAGSISSTTVNTTGTFAGFSLGTVASATGTMAVSSFSAKSF